MSIKELCLYFGSECRKSKLIFSDKQELSNSVKYIFCHFPFRVANNHQKEHLRRYP